MQDPEQDRTGGAARFDAADGWDYRSLTAFRGVAALMVVCYHYTGGFVPDLDPRRVTELIFQGYLWVDFFFMLSGFVLAHAYGRTFRGGVEPRAMRSFVLARVARIYPLHLVVLAGFVLIELCRGLSIWTGVASFPLAPFDGPKSLGALLLNIGLLQSYGFQDHLSWNGPAWSISAEWMAYLCFPVLVLIGARLAPRHVLGVVALCLLGLAALSGGGRDLDVTYNGGVWRGLFGFVLGMVIHAAMPWLRARAIGRWLGAGASVLAIGALLLLVMHLGVADLISTSLMGVLLTALALNDRAGGRLAAGLARPVPMWLGQISYSVYLGHMLLLEAVLVGGQVLLGHPPGIGLGLWGSIALVVPLFVLALLFGQLLHHRVEQPAREAWRRSRLGRRFVDWGATPAQPGPAPRGAGR